VSSKANASSDDEPRRPYKSSRRAQQAAQTRRDVLAAATRLYEQAGWAKTTINAIAADAGVAVETVYSGYGSKKALLRAAIDTAVVGDAEPTPLVERPEFQALAKGSRAERIDAGITLQSRIHARSAGVWRAVMEASAADPEIDSWRLDLERGRRIDARRGVELMLGHEIDDVTADLLWAVLSPEVYLKFTADLGLTQDEYQSLVKEAFVRITVQRRPTKTG
jgi:AcrR family transcriptional regulator